MVVWSIARTPDYVKPFIDANVCRFFWKGTVLENLAEVVGFLDKGGGRTLPSTLWESLMIQPNAWGVGVDLKPIIRWLRRR
jgi:hypothetical protein